MTCTCEDFYLSSCIQKSLGFVLVIVFIAFFVLLKRLFDELKHPRVILRNSQWNEPLTMLQPFVWYQTKILYWVIICRSLGVFKFEFCPYVNKILTINIYLLKYIVSYQDFSIMQCFYKYVVCSLILFTHKMKSMALRAEPLWDPITILHYWRNFTASVNILRSIH